MTQLISVHFHSSTKSTDVFTKFSLSHVYGSELCSNKLLFQNFNVFSMMSYFFFLYKMTLRQELKVYSHLAVSWLLLHQCTILRQVSFGNELYSLWQHCVETVNYADKILLTSHYCECCFMVFSFWVAAK